MLPRRTREPRTGQSAQRARHQDAASIDLVPEVVTEEEEANDETILPLGDGEEPDWLPDAAEVFSGYARPGELPAADVADARDALEAAGIPCHVEVVEEAEEARASPTVMNRLRLLVPGQLNFRAIGILDRDIFNQDFEADWRAHLEQLSDEELREMKPKDVFCGLFDRIERVNRAYGDEVTRRQLKSQSA